MKRALITGITGQDGAYLAKFLLEKGYKVFGTYRRISTPNFWRLQYLDVLQKIILIPADMTDMASLLEAVTVADPDEIYNLAAQSYVGASYDQPLHTTEIDGSGATRLLEVIRHLKKDIKFYQASTSELFGTVEESPQSEKTRFWPNSPYAAAKLLSYHNVRIYREAYGIFACNGILFNHESPLRGLEFVTRKITNAVARIKLGLQKELVLGNLEAKRDWGFAPEFV
jgi:GDPmannose 4,6-dehydratase